jgi:hypothetical protein
MRRKKKKNAVTYWTISQFACTREMLRNTVTLLNERVMAESDK